jgi:hypothetical protein
MNPRASFFLSSLCFAFSSLCGTATAALWHSSGASLIANLSLLGSAISLVIAALFLVLGIRS